MKKLSSTMPASQICVTYHWAVRIVCIFSILGFVWFTGLVWYLGQSAYALFFAAFVIFGIYSLTTTFTTTCVGAIGITVTTLTATYAMAWDEITTVETNPTNRSAVGNTLVFRGGTKAIVVSLVFASKEGEQMRRFLIQQIAQQGLEVQSLNSISPKNMNTKQLYRR